MVLLSPLAAEPLPVPAVGVAFFDDFFVNDGRDVLRLFSIRTTRTLRTHTLLFPLFGFVVVNVVVVEWNCSVWYFWSVFFGILLAIRCEFCVCVFCIVRDRGIDGERLVNDMDGSVPCADDFGGRPSMGLMDGWLRRRCSITREQRSFEKRIAKAKKHHVRMECVCR